MADVAAAFNRRGFAVPDDLAARLASVAAASGGPDAAALAFEAYAMDSNIPRGELTAAALSGFESTTKATSAAVAAKRAAFGGLSWDDAADALVDGTNAGLRRSFAAAHTPAAKKSVLGGAGGRTPAAAAAAATPAPAAAATAATPASGAAARTPGSAAFARRAGSGEAVATLAPSSGPLADGPLPAPRAAAAGPRVEVALVGGGGGAAGASAGPARLLTDSLADRAAFLEGRIGGFAAAFEAATGTAPSAPVGVALQDEGAVFAGRVVCEASGGGAGATATAGGGRLNAASIVLEGSAALSNGGRARLDVSKLVGPGGPGFRLFPGQAVAVTGACPAGHTLVASGVHASAPLPPAASTRHALARFSAATGPAGMHVLVAAGPYTPPDGDGLDYSPLDAVLAAAAGGGGGAGGARPADALVLHGPFVDAAHPAWTSPSAPDASFADIFAGQVLGRLAAFADGRAAAGAPLPPIVLVPSVRDATGLPTLPQPPLPLPAGCPACVHALPNPATFRLNEVVVGATASDPLFAIAGCEAGAGPGGGARGDRMAGLASALLEQRCFYPAYPPAPGACLDARRAAGGGLEMGGGAASPDVLLLPSDLAPFARVAAAAVPLPAAVKAEAGTTAAAGGAVRSVAINPGRCVRPGGGGGTVAWLDVGPAVENAGGGDDDLAMDVDGAAAGGGVTPHAVDGRARVEVVRL